MNKLVLVAATLGALNFGLSSCSKDVLDKVFSVSISQAAEAQFTIPEVPVAGVDTTLGSAGVYFNLDSIIQDQTNNDYNINTVSKVFVQELTFSLSENGANGADSANNLANFEKGKVEFLSNSNTTPLVYEFTIPDAYTTTVTIPVDKSVNLKSYAEGNMFTYTFSGKARRVTTKPLDATVKMKFKIEK